MQNALTLQQLVQTLEDQNTQKADYVVPPSKISMQDGLLIVDGTKGNVYTPNEVTHGHIAAKLGIPRDYYRRMQDANVDLLDENVNSWLKKADQKGMLLRTFEHESGNIGRALLSDKYGAFDNYDILFAALEAIKRSGIKVEIRECSISDTNMYVNIVAPEVEVESKGLLANYMRNTRGNKVGDSIVSGLCLKNSEVGFGSYVVCPRGVIVACNNGMINKSDQIRRVHLGVQLTEGEVRWSNRTVENNRKLVLSQTADAIRYFLSKGYLTKMVQKLEAASKQELDNPLDTVENVVKHVATKVSITEDQKRSILNYFVNDGDQRASGVFQALTRGCQALEADGQFEMEAMAFELLPKIKSFDRPVAKK